MNTIVARAALFTLPGFAELVMQQTFGIRERSCTNSLANRCWRQICKRKAFLVTMKRSARKQSPASPEKKEQNSDHEENHNSAWP